MNLFSAQLFQEIDALNGTKFQDTIKDLNYLEAVFFLE
jgi:hypothetical protein